MARKVVNRKQLREEAEAAEKSEATKKKATKKKAATKKRKTRKKKKDPADIRIKLYWGVFSQSLKRVALYEYSQRKQAMKKAEDLNATGKSPHFVQKVKEEIEDEVVE